MSSKPLIIRLLAPVRNLRSRHMFQAMKKYCRGDVLDVGGWDFYLTVKRRKLKFLSWTTLECEERNRPEISESNYRFLVGDGCDMPLAGHSFDTVLNIQVLEHVLHPLKMVREIARVLRPRGYAVFLIPQTSTLHLAPDHYYNFTRFWIEKAMAEAGLKIVELKPLGGIWSSMASHLCYFFLQSFRVKGMTAPGIKRNLFYYLFYPLMVGWALISIPINMFLSLGDLSEEPNNHLVIVKKD